MMKAGKSARSKSSSVEKVSKRPKQTGSSVNIVVILIAMMIVSIVSVAFFTIPDKEVRLKMTISSLKHLFHKSNQHPHIRTHPPTAAIEPAVQTPTTQSIVEIKKPAVEEDDTPPQERISTPPPTKAKKHPKFDLHFIHIPKCGGTTMTSILRQIECALDPVKNADCCLNPGFCDWHAKRRCSVIQGCINHFPNREFIFENMPSIAVFREPVSRVLSAWFYRGHNPNLDFFQVRPEFKNISMGLAPKKTFAEYIEMHEYHNIQTRMLGADSFPYRDIVITDEIFEEAVTAVNGLFFVGLQEEFELSALGIARAMKANITIKIEKERDNGGLGPVKRDKEALRNNKKLMDRLREVNTYDLKLWDIVVERFCRDMSAYPDLYAKVKSNGKVKCK